MNTGDALPQSEAVKKLYGMLGLARKAGKIISGTELVCDAVRHGKAAHVYIASDVSQNTQKRIVNCCTFYETAFTVLSAKGAELGKSVGKQSFAAALAVTDKGFAAAVSKITDENSVCCKADSSSAGGADI